MNPSVTIPIETDLTVVLDTSRLLVKGGFRGIWSSRFDREAYGAPVRMMYAAQRAVKLLLENRMMNILHTLRVRVESADGRVDCSSFEAQLAVRIVLAMEDRNRQESS
jgi:hypothetical protein